MFDEQLSSPNRGCEFTRRNFVTGWVRHFYSRTSARKGYSYLKFSVIREEQDTYSIVSGKSWIHILLYQERVGYIFQCIREEQDTYSSVSGKSRIHISSVSGMSRINILVYQIGVGYIFPCIYEGRVGYIFQCIREEQDTYSRVSERSRIHILVYQGGVGYIFQCIREQQDTYSNVSGRSRIHILE